MTLPKLGLSSAEIEATAASIAAVQRPGGAIPWFVGGHLDPWDHVQAAMGLAVAGRPDAAAAAYDWLRGNQRADGTWATQYVGDDLTTLENDAADANFTAYVATGVWHQWRLTEDHGFVRRLWPTVTAALDAVLRMQADDGTIRWSRTSDGRLSDESLVTGNASIHLSLRCGVALAEVMGESRPRWVEAAIRIRHALDHHEDRFTPKSRFSMDWYYPLLGAAVSDDFARERLASRWDDFVVPDQGVRCVDDHPWVTGGESCELVLALDAFGRGDEAAQILRDVQRLRAEDGSYWTGYVYRDDAFWPIEQATWTAATMLLASDALTRGTAANGVFRGEGLPLLADRPPVLDDCACAA